MKTIDYTTSRKRLGSNTPDGKLVSCQKCEKKGAFTKEAFDQKTGMVWPATVVHKYKVATLSRHFDVGSQCYLPLSEQGEALRGVKGLFEGLRILFRDAIAAELKALYPDGYGRAYFTISLNPTVVAELLQARERAEWAEALLVVRKVVTLDVLKRALARIEALDWEDGERKGHELHSEVGEGPTGECDVCRIEALFKELGGTR